MIRSYPGNYSLPVPPKPPDKYQKQNIKFSVRSMLLSHQRYFYRISPVEFILFEGEVDEFIDRSRSKPLSFSDRLEFMRMLAQFGQEDTPLDDIHDEYRETLLTIAYNFSVRLNFKKREKDIKRDREINKNRERD